MSELTDLELCKRIAEIEGAKSIDIVGGEVCALFVINVCGVTSYEQPYHGYNPLTDDGLCFRLIIKYKVLITWHGLNDNCTAVIDCTDSEEFPFPFSIADCNDESPNKAILLAIIEAHKTNKVVNRNKG